MSLMSDRFAAERLPQMKREAFEKFCQYQPVTSSQFKLARRLPPTKKQIRAALKQKLEIEQDGLCAICQRLKPLSMDHDHKTEVYRGLLCATCNSMIGLAYENPSILIRAVRYLRKWARLQKGGVDGRGEV